jgi:hypothetical protein
LTCYAVEEETDKIFNIFDPVAKKCVKKCPAGKINTSGECASPGAECSDTDGVKCTTCTNVATHHLLDGACVTACSATTTLNEGSNVCENCPTGEFMCGGLCKEYEGYYDPHNVVAINFTYGTAETLILFDNYLEDIMNQH